MKEQRQIQRITIQVPQNIYEKVKRYSEKIDIPVASFISMMVVDTFMSPQLNVTDGKRRKKETNVTMQISLDRDLYEKVHDFVSEYESYTIREFILDCIEYKMEDFEVLTSIKSKEYTQRLQISHTETNKYSKETKRQYSKKSLVDIYIERKSVYWGISKEAIKKYYLAQKVSENLRIYKAEKKIFAGEEDTEYL